MPNNCCAKDKDGTCVPFVVLGFFVDILTQTYSRQSLARGKKKKKKKERNEYVNELYDMAREINTNDPKKKNAR